MANGKLRDLPLAARLLILGMAGLGCVAVAARVFDFPQWGRQDLIACLALVTGIAITEQFPIPVRYRTETINFSLTEALWVGALTLARPSVLTLSVAGGLLIAQVIRNRPAFKIAFNVGQFLVALSVAQAIYAKLHPSTLWDPRAWLAASLAMAGYAVVNATVVAAIISAVEKRSLLSVLIPPLGANALHFIGNTALGLEGAVVWMVSPILLTTLLIPLGLAFMAYRVLARSVQEGERARALIVEYASDGIFVAASDGTILSWNPAMERISGYAAAEAVGQKLGEVLGARWLGREQSPAGQGTATSAGAIAAIPLTRKDGTQAWVHHSSSAITQGRLEATVGVVHDVTADRLAEQIKSDFVAMISHELRTPLTPLKGFLSTLLQGMVDDTQEAREEYYRIMLKQTDRLETLITDLLEVSRIESDRPLVEHRPIQIGPQVADQVRSFSDQHPGREIGLVLEDRPVIASADPDALDLIVSNLISNALKYSPPDEPIEVGIEVRGQDAVISVSDRGEGIPLSEQERIFDRFYQVENHMTRRSGGTGLGLFIARRLVEAMSGRIWVESIPGHGSVFSFSLHLAPEEDAESPSLVDTAPPVVRRLDRSLVATS